MSEIKPRSSTTSSSDSTWTASQSPHPRNTSSKLNESMSPETAKEATCIANRMTELELAATAKPTPIHSEHQEGIALTKTLDKSRSHKAHCNPASLYSPKGKGKTNSHRIPRNKAHSSEHSNQRSSEGQTRPFRRKSKSRSKYKSIE